jgi:cytochrome c oxidase subunit II
MSNLLTRAVAAVAGSLLAAGPAFAAWDVNMPVGVTEISRDVHKLHMLIFWICVAIALTVFGAMIYSIVHFRRSRGAVPDATMTHSTRAEMIWTVIPIAILIGMAIPAAETLVTIEDTRDSDLTIKVTGYQWKWHYDYVDSGVSFFSSLAPKSNEARQLGSGIDPRTIDNYLLDVDNPLVVPEGAKVRVLLTSGDVIHAWWVPTFGMKKDAIPGFVNEMWFRADATGIYRGQCAELCGRDHGFMPVVVDVRSQEEFDVWLEQRRTAAAGAAGTTHTLAASGPDHADESATTTVAKAE